MLIPEEDGCAANPMFGGMLLQIYSQQLDPGTKEEIENKKPTYGHQTNLRQIHIYHLNVLYVKALGKQ